MRSHRKLVGGHRRVELCGCFLGHGHRGAGAMTAMRMTSELRRCRRWPWPDMWTGRPCLLYAPPPRGCEVAMARGRPLLSHAPLTFHFILGRGDELRSALQLQHIDQMDNTYIIVPIPTNKWIIHALPKQHGYGFGYGHWLSRCLAELVCYK